MILFEILFGAIIGSFLTVCIHRIPYGRPKGPPPVDEEDETNESDIATPPLERLSIVYPPRSFCPHCKTPLRWWHNIPIVSFLLLKGKCATCKTPISIRYPLVELLSATSCVASFQVYDLTPTATGVYLALCILIVISFIDIEYYIIPDVISLPLIPIGLGLAFINQYYSFLHYPFADSLFTSVLGLVMAGGFLWLISEIYYRVRGRIGLGFGDVKLLAWFGVFFGLSGAFCSLFLGSVIGTVVGISMTIFCKKTFMHQLPFGPYLAAGLILYLFGFNPFPI